MVEKVVYILGAGFSAPLGLPVMSNFIEKAKDMYFGDTANKYSYFKEIFEELDKMSVIKNHFNCDLSNIEEVLSILTMNETIKASRGSFKKKYIQFIKDVIEKYTPPYQISYSRTESLLHNFYSKDLSIGYLSFVANLFQIQIGARGFKDQWGMSSPMHYSQQLVKQYDYSVITLNYDLVLENAVQKINDFFSSNLFFNKDSTFPSLAKLHGCISRDDIIPPTWNKSNNHKSIKDSWCLAGNLIQNANHIRVLGYSLPKTDAYIKYLLKSAVIANKHLKTIDVVCLDKDRNTENQYREFISHPNFNFYNRNLTDYIMDLIMERRNNQSNDDYNWRLNFSTIEKTHKALTSGTLPKRTYVAKSPQGDI